MRRIIITSLLCGLFLAACSKSGGVTRSVDNQAPVSQTVTAASTAAAGSGKPAASAIDDVTSTQDETKSPLPPPAGFVNDYAKVIDEQTKKNLETNLKKLKDDSKIEFFVVTVDTTGNQSSADYAMAVARGWRIGAQEQNEGGLILLIAIKDRRWQIRWSHSLEDTLQNGTAAELERRMTGLFRQGKYSKGIASGVEAVMLKLNNRRPLSP